jgi:hypothetical protein
LIVACFSNMSGEVFSIWRGLISPWLYKENNKLWDWKKNVFTYFPLGSTHLWLHRSNFFNTCKKNSFGCAANRKTRIGKVKDLSAPLHITSGCFISWLPGIL